MCIVSMIGDQWGQDFPQKWPQYPPYTPGQTYVIETIPRHEFEALKKEVEELKKLLLAAKKYDEATGQPDCEMDKKVEMIKAIAEALGVDMEEVFGKK